MPRIYKGSENKLNLLIPLCAINTDDGMEEITITQNGEYEGAFDKVNVNVILKINVAENGLKFGKSTFTEVPDFYDFSDVTDMSYVFYQCPNLTSIPEIDTSNVTNMGCMFYNCTSLNTIPLLDTSNVTDMSNMFYYCSNLTTIPEIDTSNVTNMGKMFYRCSNLTSIPEIDTSNVTNMAYMFYQCSNLTSIPALDCSSIDTSSNSTAWFGSINLYNLTDIGGFINLKISSIKNYGLVRCPNLTYQSCINVLNGLYDFTGNGETPDSSQGQLKVHSNFLTAVGDEISIGVAKGWIITA